MTFHFEECEPRPVFRGFQGGKLGQKQQPHNVYILDFGEACRAYWAAIKRVHDERIPLCDNCGVKVSDCSCFECELVILDKRTIFRSLEEPRDN